MHIGEQTDAYEIEPEVIPVPQREVTHEPVAPEPVEEPAYKEAD